MLQGDGSGAAVSKEFKVPDFINNAFLGGAPEKSQHSIRDDQSALFGLQRFDAFEYTNRNALARQQGSGE